MRFIHPPTSSSSTLVIALLPVEQANSYQYGDPYELVRKHHLAQTYNCLFVFPDFKHIPWYADHPNKTIAQESYMISTFLEEIDQLAKKPIPSAQRLLIGFSKSGWGAITLLLRHPQIFGRAAAWDAPFTLKAPDRWGTSEIFGTQENFNQYRLEHILTKRRPRLGSDERLALSGYGSFKVDIDYAHQLFIRHNIPHRFANQTQAKHIWSTAWLIPLLNELISMSGSPPTPKLAN